MRGRRGTSDDGRYRSLLAELGLEVTPAQWAEGVALLEQALAMTTGPIEHRSHDPELYALLYHLSPRFQVHQGWLHERDAHPHPFTGWEQLRAELQAETRGMSVGDVWAFLQSAFGPEAARVAHAVLTGG